MDGPSIVLLYSGGYDSLVVAVELARKFRSVDLVTFRVMGSFATHLSRRNDAKLKKNFPSTKFTHRIFDIRAIHREVLTHFIDDCVEYEDYLPPFQIWCGLCQLAMRIAVILYCLRENIAFCADGVRRDQVYYQIHTVEVVNAMKQMFADYGITLINPVYDYSGNPEEYLWKLGYDIGSTRWKKSYTGTQPICFHSLSGIGCRTYQVCHRISNEAKGDFIRSKIPEAKKIIDHYISKSGIKKTLEKSGTLVGYKDRFTQTGPYFRPDPDPEQVLLCRCVTPFYVILRLVIRVLRLMLRSD